MHQPTANSGHGRDCWDVPPLLTADETCYDARCHENDWLQIGSENTGVAEGRTEMSKLSDRSRDSRSRKVAKWSMTLTNGHTSP